jgi:hypothetical protein
MDDLSRFCCLNSNCPEHGKRGAGNLTVTSRYGSQKERRMLRCRVCKARFSERKGTPYFDSRLPPETFRSVLDRGWPGQLVVRVAQRQEARGSVRPQPGVRHQTTASCGSSTRTEDCPGHPA